MLVVTSNWGLADGTLVGGAVSRLVHRLHLDVRRAAWRCGMRQDGCYRPIESVDLVLAGDTFDWLTSREWTGTVKPWQAGTRTMAALERVVAAAARRAGRLRATLAGWSRRGIAVPIADRRGRPVPASQVRVPVRVTVLRGDRDRWIDRLPAAAAGLLPGAAVGISWSDGALTVIHGDQLDGLHEAATGAPSLGESLTVDLIAAFGIAIDDLPAVRPQAEAIVRMLAAGPVLEAPERLAGWLDFGPEGGLLPPHSRARLLAAWNATVWRWHKEARRLAVSAAGGIDVVDHVAAGLEVAGPADRRPGVTTGHGRGGNAADGSPGAATAIMLGHAFSRGGGSWPRGVVCLPGGVEEGWPPLAVIAAAEGIRRDRRIDWPRCFGTTGQPASHGAASAERSSWGVWLSDAPDPRRPFVDAA